jgi:hypothetical protein
MSIPKDVAAALLGLVPSIIEVIAEALRANDPKRALRIAASAMAAERAALAAVDIMIATERGRK